jgi:hypothetical protein
LAFLSFESRCFDRTILQGATNGALDPIERFGSDSYFARLNLRDRPRIQSAARRQFVLANPEKCSFSPEVCAQRLAQGIFHDAVPLR